MDTFIHCTLIFHDCFHTIIVCTISVIATKPINIVDTRITRSNYQRGHLIQCLWETRQLPASLHSLPSVIHLVPWVTIRMFPCLNQSGLKLKVFLLNWLLVISISNYKLIIQCNLPRELMMSFKNRMYVDNIERCGTMVGSGANTSTHI